MHRLLLPYALGKRPTTTTTDNAATKNLKHVDDSNTSNTEYTNTPIPVNVYRLFKYDNLDGTGVQNKNASVEDVLPQPDGQVLKPYVYMLEPLLQALSFLCTTSVHIPMLARY